MKHVVSTAVFLVCLGFLSPASAVLMYEATLSGTQEVPAVVSSASGTASLSLNYAQTRLEINISLTGLDLDGLQTPNNTADDIIGLHIHAAPPGSNGGVVFGLISPNNDLNGDLVINPVLGTIFSAWDLNEGNGTTLADQLPVLFAGNLYFNVHTVTFPAGEIRGQIVSVPEPAILTLLALGLAGIGYQTRIKINAI